MTTDDLARLSTIAGPRAQHLAAITPYYAQFYLERNHVRGIYVHDSTTISYLLAPHLFTWKELPIRVDTGHSVCRGTTLPALRDSDDEGLWQGRRAVRILTDVDARGVIELELEHLSR
jgi:inosine-uridine nucleoside N-ribohydrolase